jgi:DNA polymerase III psi subunit
MQDNADVSEEAILNDVSRSVQIAISNACCLNPENRTQITKKSYENALNKLV